MIFREPTRTAFDLNGRLFGIHVRVHPTFWLFAALFGWSYIQLGFQYVLLWILCMFVSILVHELGHVLMGIACGSWGHIVLYSFGGLAVGSNDLPKRWQRIAVLLAGPGAGLLLFAAVYLAVYGLGLLNRLDPAARMPLLWASVRMLLFMNLVWNVLNLMPIFPLDGGQTAIEIASGVSPKQGLRTALIISFLTACGVIGYSFYAMQNRNIWYPGIDPLFAMLFFGFLGAQSFFMLQSLRRERARPWDDEGY